MVPGTARCRAHGGFPENTTLFDEHFPGAPKGSGRSSLRPCGPGRKLFPGWRVLGLKRFRFGISAVSRGRMIARLPLNSMRRRSGVLLSGERRMAEEHAPCCGGSLRGGGMKLLFKGPFIITPEAASSVWRWPVLFGRKARKPFPFAVRRRARTLREAGLPAFPLMNRKAAERAGGCSVNRPPIWSMMHSRFESLIAGAAPEAIMEWAAVDIGLRARLVRAVGRSACSARRFRALRVRFIQRRRVPAEGQGYYAAISWLAEHTRAPCRGAVRKGYTRLFLAPELAGCRAGRGIWAQERRTEKRMPIGRLVPHG